MTKKVIEILQNLNSWNLKFSVLTIVVDGVVIDADYDTIQKKACADGSSASVCSSA